MERQEALTEQGQSADKGTALAGFFAARSPEGEADARNTAKLISFWF